MKRLVLGACLSLAVLGAFAAAAGARTSFCSPTGDFCQAVKGSQSKTRFAFDSFAHVGDVTVCVTKSGRSGDCKDFRLRSKGSGIRGMSARWRSHFPHKGAGSYRVVWRQEGVKIGRTLSFRIR